MNELKYLDLENATLKLQLNTILEYEQFFQQFAHELKDLNFKRIYVKVLNESLKYSLDMFKSLNLPLIIETDLYEDLDFDIPDNLTIINTNSNLQISRQNIYNQIILNELTLEKIVNLINSNVDIVIEPEIDIKNIFKFNQCLNLLFKRVPNKKLNIGNFLLPTNLLKEHPCNCYLCNGFKCHQKISGLPKVILIDEDFNLYPHMIINKNLIMGNLKENQNFQSLLMNYMDSKEHNAFVKCCKKIFIKYLPNYPFQYFPVAEFIKEVANEM